MKVKDIFLNKELVEETNNFLKYAKSNGYFVVDGNLLAIDKIVTILKPEVNSSIKNLNKIVETLSFSYNDKVMPMVVNLKIKYEDPSCLKFVEVGQLLNEVQYEALSDKVEQYINEFTTRDLKSLADTIDNMVLNETILFLTKGINKDDCETTKNEIMSKFEAWKERINNENENIHCLMTSLYGSLINLKLNQ